MANVRITITGRHMQVSDDLKQYALTKAARLERYNDQLREVEVVLTEHHDERNVAEMIAYHRRGERLVGQTEHQDMFAAIDLLVDKMYGQLSKAKQKAEGRRRGKGKNGRRTAAQFEA